MIVAPTFLANSASRPSNDWNEIRGSSPDRGPEHVQPLLDGEERLLADVDGHRHDEPVGESQAPADQVFVAPRGRVEGAGVDRDAGHGAWQKVMAVSP